MTEDHARREQRVGRLSIFDQFDLISSQLAAFGGLMATVQDEIDRLKNDVTNYIGLMRGKVQSLTDQVTALRGQVDTAAADQMRADAQSLSDSLDQLETALAQDNPPSDGNTASSGTSDSTGGDVPAARRH